MSNVESTKKISEIMMLPLAAKALNVAAELGLADLLKEGFARHRRTCFSL